MASEFQMDYRVVTGVFVKYQDEEGYMCSSYIPVKKFFTHDVILSLMNERKTQFKRNLYNISFVDRHDKLLLKLERAKGVRGFFGRYKSLAKKCIECQRVQAEAQF